MKEPSEQVRKLLAEADAAFGRRDWERAARLWAQIPTAFDVSEYSIGDVALQTSVAQRLASLTAYADAIAQYHAERARRAAGHRPRIALFTSIVGGYDSVKMPHLLDARFDYILFTEAVVSGGGLWDVRPVTAANCSAARASRYVKMHPHHLLADYDIAIWIDSNVMVLGDLYPSVEEFLAAPEAVGAIQHPHRDNIYQEAGECIRQNKDASRPILAQIARYRKERFVHDDLVEANVLMFKLGDTRLHAFLDRWWAELESGSRRDQLSFNYALRQTATDWHRLLERPASARTHPAFAYVGHDRGAGVAQVLIDELGTPPCDPYTVAGQKPYVRSCGGQIQASTVDVILLMESAPSGEAPCRDTLAEARKAFPFEVRIVAGDTAAVNAALAASQAACIVLLEADVRVPKSWMGKMLGALLSTPGAGIVAPLVYTAASPAALETPETPDEPDELDQACERASVCGLTPRVPAASGICLGLRREVVGAIGLLDQDAFARQVGWDVDYCFRAADAGFATVIATPTCVVVGERLTLSPGGLPEFRPACDALAGRHGGRRVSRAFMTLKDEPIVQRQRARMCADRGGWVDIAMPRVLSLQPRRRHT